MNFTLEELEEAMIFFSPNQCRVWTENCIVSLEHNNILPNCLLKVTGDKNFSVPILWSSKVSKAGYKEPIKFTEKGAEALSFLLAIELTEYEVIEEATIRTGIDYWLGYDETHPKFDNLNFFQARLEISGILKESASNTLEKRVVEKKTQTKQSDATLLPAYISVVEFSNPKAYFAIK